MPKPDAAMKATCAARLRLVQRAFSEELLLVVPGPDGRYNVGSQALLKYLFGGASGAELSDPETAGSLPARLEALEDVMLAVGRDGVSIYYPAAARRAVLPFVAAWPNVTEHVLRAADADNVAAAELFKVRSFVAAVKGKGRKLAWRGG
jgi:hypothetical protein